MKRPTGLRLGIDIDEVIGEFCESFLDIWNEKHGTDYHREQLKNYSMTDVLGVSGAEVHREIIDQQINHQYLNMRTIPHAKKYLTKLHNDDNEIYLVTGREAALDTVLWLRKQQIPFDDLFLTRSKTPILEGLKVHAFVDDCLDNIVEAEAAGINCVIFDRPWNRHYNVSNAPRVHSWYELYKHLGRIDVND